MAGADYEHFILDDKGNTADEVFRLERDLHLIAAKTWLEISSRSRRLVVYSGSVIWPLPKYTIGVYAVRPVEWNGVLFVVSVNSAISERYPRFCAGYARYWPDAEGDHPLLRLRRMIVEAVENVDVPAQASVLIEPLDQIIAKEIGTSELGS